MLQRQEGLMYIITYDILFGQVILSNIYGSFDLFSNLICLEESNTLRVTLGSKMVSGKITQGVIAQEANLFDE